MKPNPHVFTRKICHWQYCAKCGLVALKNEPTEQAIKLGCDWQEIMKGKRK
jgi:hypothetical protein